MSAAVSPKALFLAVFLFLMLGDFLSISQLAPTINYNYLNSSLMYVASGLLFAYVARYGDAEKRMGWPPVVFLLMSGACMGFDFFIKFTSSVQFLVVGALFLLLGLAGPLKGRLLPVGWLGAGYLLGMGVYFLFFQSFDAWYSAFLANIEAQTGGTHSPRRIISKQANDFVRIGKAILQYTLVPILLAFAVARLHLRRPESLWWLLVPVLIGAELYLSLLEYKPHNLRLNTLLYVSILLILGMMALAAVKKPFRIDGRKVLGLVFLIAIPMLLVFGSDSSFSYSIPLYLLPWFAAIWMALGAVPAGKLRVAALVSIALVAQVEFVVGYLYHPWRYVQNRLAQTEPVPNVPELRGIRVDPLAHRFIVESQALAGQSTTASKVMLGIYEMPGLVYWLRGYPPGLPWFSHSEHEQATACRSLKATTDQASDAEVGRALLLIQNEPLPELAACMQELGIRLENYRLIGETINVYSGKTVRVYEPLPEGTP